MSQNGQTYFKNLAQMLQIFEMCLTILGNYALKGKNYIKETELEII